MSVYIVQNMFGTITCLQHQSGIRDEYLLPQDGHPKTAKLLEQPHQARVLENARPTRVFQQEY